MNDNDLITLWKSHDQKLQENLTLSRENMEEITKLKVQSFLGSMKPTKLFTLLVGIVWVGVGSVIVVNLFRFAFAEVSKFFLFSAAIQLLITLLAIVVYIYQLVVIYQVDISAPILETQEKVASLKSSTIWVTRILFLQLPVWTTFYLSEHIFETTNVVFYLIQGLLTLSFTGLAVWLFININFRNRDKWWFRLIFESREWTPLMKSMEILDQVNGYK